MKRSHYIFALGMIVCCTACEKFLSEKSDKSFVLADKLENLQALLDHSSVINQNYEVAGEGSADDFYLAQADFNNLREDFRNQYTWQPGHVFPRAALAANGWQQSYAASYVFATVIHGLDDIPRTADVAYTWDAIRGQALALRAYRYLNAASIWAPAYDPATANTDWGIPIRLASDYTEPTSRATVAATFRQIIDDAETSIALLPVVNNNAYRANKAFAYGILARAHWYMRRYEEAGRYADSCMQLHHALIDFNGLNASATFPISNTNPEIIHYAQFANLALTNPTRAKITDDLFGLYEDDDLRKTVFFSRNADGSHRFKGNYAGSAVLFAGLSTNEMLLIRAECRVRGGNVAEAISDLNRLRQHRFHAENYRPVSTDSPADALALILIERRRELPMRGLRWMDIKRLNKEGAGITLSREIDGLVHTLPPNDPRFALAIPEDIIILSGIPQNLR